MAPVEKKKNRWGIIVLLISFFIVTLVRESPRIAVVVLLLQAIC